MRSPPRYAYVSIPQHTSGMHTSAYLSMLTRATELYERALASQVCIRQHTSAYVRYAYVSIPQHADTRHGAVRACARLPGMHTSAYVSIRQHTYVPTELYERALASQVCIRLHTSAYVSMRQHTSAYLSIPQHTYAAPLQPKHVPAICNYVC